MNDRDLIDLNIYENNNYDPNLRVLRQAATTGVMTEAPGLIDLIYSISATKNGPPIDPALSGAAIERVDASSVYHRLFPGAVHSPILFPAYAGKNVFLRLYNPGLSVNIVIEIAIRKHRYV